MEEMNVEEGLGPDGYDRKIYRPLLLAGGEVSTEGLHPDRWITERGGVGWVGWGGRNKGLLEEPIKQT